jgi:transposase
MRVYSYGAAAPIANITLVSAQMRHGHDYYNQLVEIEREHRSDREKELRADPRYYPATFIDVRACYDEAGALADGEAFSPELKARFAKAFAAMSAARKEAAKVPAIAASLDLLEKAFVVRQKALRAASPAEWGTRGVREAAMRASRKTGREPGFRKFDGSGMIAVQLQKGSDKLNGMSVADLLSCKDTRLRLSLPGACPCYSCRSPHRKNKHSVLSMRVGSDGRDPIWADIPVTVHRDLPSSARIKLVRLHRRVVGVSTKWEVQFVVDTPEQPPKTDPSPSAAIDIGWRRIGDGLRVAWIVGEDGLSEELRLPATLLARKHKVEELRAIQDLPPEPESAEDTRRRLAVEKSLGRPLTPTEIERTRKRHLHQWEDHQRDNVFRARREIYRVFAAKIAKRYRRVVIEDMDLRKFAVLPKTEPASGPRAARPGVPDDPVTKAAREWRFFAACSELKACITNAVTREGGEVLEADPAWTTRACFACGASVARIEDAPRSPDDPARNLNLTCPACSATFDQDENAARNLLRALQRQPATPPRSRPKREPGGVFRAKHRKKAAGEDAKSAPLAEAEAGRGTGE